MFFNLVFDLFYWTEGWWRSVSLLIGSEREVIFDMIVLRKNYLVGCQTPSSKKVCWDNLTKSVFQSRCDIILLNWGVAEECIPPSRSQKRRNFWSSCSTKNVLRWLSDSEFKKFSLGNLTKCVFQSVLGLNLLNSGLEEKYIPPSRFWKRRIFRSVCSTKKVLKWLSDFELKNSL